MSTQSFDPFARPTKAAVQAHVLAVAVPLSETYRVEVIWDAPGNVRVPNGALMVGAPGTEAREYYTLTLPASLRPDQIVGNIDRTLQFKLESASPGWWDRLRAWFRYFGRDNPLLVREPKGLFVVSEFSTPKVLPG